MKPTIPRRKFLAYTALGAMALSTMTGHPSARGQDGAAAAAVKSGKLLTARDYLKSLLYTKEEVKQWL